MSSPDGSDKTKRAPDEPFFVLPMFQFKSFFLLPETHKQRMPPVTHHKEHENKKIRTFHHKSILNELLNLSNGL